MRQRTIEAVSKIGRLDPQVVEAKWNKTKNLPSYFPVVIADDISYDTAVKVRVANKLSV